MSDPVATLTRAGRYLMEQKDIWYDRVPNEKGDMVTGPHYQAVAIIFRLASDVRARMVGSRDAGR